MVDGFEDYLTAYPLSEIEAYAFARTWYAAEMDRPGCVWTHTLLIDVLDIGRVEALGALETCFARPDGPASAFDRYTQPLEWQARVIRSRYAADGFSAALLSALYGTPDASVLIPVADAAMLKELVFAVWNQQWNSARATFTFCTGSMASRTLAGRSFDLQLIPGASAREIRRDAQNAVVLDPAFVRSVAIEQWLDVLLRDLNEPKPQLRERLLGLGNALMAEMSARESVEPALQLLFASDGLMTRSAVDPAEVMHAIAATFPDAAQASRLKSVMIKRDSGAMRAICPSSTEADVLTALALTHHVDAFRSLDLDLLGRVQAIWNERSQDAERMLDALLRQNHNTLGEQIIAGLLATAPPEAMGHLLVHQRSVVLSMIRHDPALAALPVLWEGPWHRQRELFDAATGGVELDEETTRRIIDAMLDAKSDVLAENVIQRFGAVAADEVLAHALRNTGEIARPWARVVSRYDDLMLKRAMSTDGVSWVVVAPKVLDPHSKVVRRTELSVWANWMQTASISAAEVRTAFAAFILAMLLDRTERAAATLLAEVFELVHAAAAGESLSYEAWSFFENSVPHLSYYRNWDKCERLRRGIVDRFNDNEWPVIDFVRCARERKTLFDMLRTCYDYGKDGREMLRRLKASQAEVLTAVPSEWAEVIEYWL
jgi:hypothetical protein